jgi:phosphoadenosine phosphosulfate reductase
MYQYVWDSETGGLLLTNEIAKFSKEPRPVYSQELDTLGFDKFWNYPKDCSAPIMWAEANNYIYRGRIVAKSKGGSYFSQPEIVIIDEPEPDHKSLRPVDVDEMVRRNTSLLETLSQETIQFIYNTYITYKSKVDVFYVAFSGGKDSAVILDLVQRSLAHDDFIVLFGNTQMEFPDTYDNAKTVKEMCTNQGIHFFESTSAYKPSETWKLFGPPATVTRWCCSVHKTAPQILLLRDLLGKQNFKGMAFVGVRGDESLARSKYEKISYGEKHKGQYSCNAILDWNSAEVFLYIFQQNLPLNRAYVKGNRRVGCLVCPRAAERNDFMSHHCYPDETDVLIDSIRYVYKDTFPEEDRLEEFIGNGGWKARKNGRDLSISTNYKEKKDDKGNLIIEVINPRQDWKVWMGTIGVFSEDESRYIIKFKEKIITFDVKELDGKLQVSVDRSVIRDIPEFSKSIKEVFRKSASCIGCQVCQADCPSGALQFKDGKVEINANCIHCSKCHKVDKGCLVYKSLEPPSYINIMSGKNTTLNTYSHHAPKWDWIRQYFEYKNTFGENHSLGSQMYGFFKRFLRDAQLLDSSGFTRTAEIVEKIGIDASVSWGIILTNLSYTPQVGWFVQNTKFNEEYSRQYLSSMMLDAGAKESWTGDIYSSLTRLVALPLGSVGLGKAIFENKKATALIRDPWVGIDPRVLLYSLYQFAEHCGGYYQFSLSDLLDDSIERDGVSPTQIFGIERERMIPLLNGLSANYSDLITVSFSLGLETINLNSEKSAQDVLSLF